MGRRIALAKQRRQPLRFGALFNATSPSPSPSSVEPQLFIVLQPDAAVVYWSAAYDGFTLEYTTDLTAPTTWTPIPGPYTFDSYFFQNREPGPAEVLPPALHRRATIARFERWN